MLYNYQNGWTFDTVMERIRQRVPEGGALNADGVCCYRVDESDPTSAACAAGAFIPDAEYRGCIEEFSADQVTDPTHCPLEPEAMNQLQCVHDQAAQGEANVHEAIEAWLRENVR